MKKESKEIVEAVEEVCGICGEEVEKRLIGDEIVNYCKKCNWVTD